MTRWLRRWWLERHAMYVPNWDRRFLPEEPVEETRGVSERDRLEEHIARVRQIPRDEQAIQEREARGR